MRYLIFFAVNVAIVIVLMFTVSVLGLGNYYLEGGGLNYAALALFSLAWGFGGAFISLLLSKWTVKLLYRIQVIDPNTTSSQEKRLLARTYEIASKAGLTRMPEVGIYDSPEANAFATGRSRNSSIVALSSGLIDNLTDEELDGVIAHEAAHIANGDMVTMTLLQGLINAFIIFFAKVLSHAAVMFLRRGSDTAMPFELWIRFGIEMLLYVLLGFLGSMIVCWYSRKREYRADYGAAQLCGKRPIASALRRLGSMDALQHKQVLPRRHSDRQGSRRRRSQQEAIAYLQISSPSSGHHRLLDLFRSHPPIEDRIARLEALQMP